MTDPLILSLLSLSSAVRERLEPAGWVYERIDATAERWVERGGRREVRVDELRGDPHGRVVDGDNGCERVVIRCVADTSPERVLQTLDLWRVLPGGAS